MRYLLLIMLCCFFGSNIYSGKHRRYLKRTLVSLCVAPNEDGQQRIVFPKQIQLSDDDCVRVENIAFARLYAKVPTSNSCASLHTNHMALSSRLNNSGIDVEWTLAFGKQLPVILRTMVPYVFIQQRR